MTRTDNSAHAWTVLNDTSYAVLATAEADGTPWATPVWFAHDHLDRLFWLSWPGSRHSQLIEQRPGIALTVFDTTAAPNEGTGFYATARAHRCPDGYLDAGLSVLNRRLLAQGLSELTRENVTGESRLRLYVAEIDEAWVLDQDADIDQRAPVARRPSPDWTGVREHRAPTHKYRPCPDEDPAPARGAEDEWAFVDHESGTTASRLGPAMSRDTPVEDARTNR